MSYEIIVSEEFDGVKPKNYLKKYIDLPYYQLFKFLKDKRITLNGKKIKDDSILREGDVIKVWLDSIKLRKNEVVFKEKQNLDIDVLYENESFMVLNKLSGVVVQGAQDNDLSLSKHLAFLKAKNNDLSDFEYFHAHRLDKETSGCLVVGKTRTALRELNEIFRGREVKKVYICLCKGAFREQKGEIELFLKRNEQGVHEKVAVFETEVQDSKRTFSSYRVIEEIDYDNETFSLVEVEIKTGFMHQIRVHMKYLGHPIIGDKMYGNSYINKIFFSKLSRQFLHASKVEFDFNGEHVKVEADLSSDLKNFIKFLKKEN